MRRHESKKKKKIRIYGSPTIRKSNNRKREVRRQKKNPDPITVEQPHFFINVLSRKDCADCEKRKQLDPTDIR
jgi:hypothetical protein